MSAASDFEYPALGGPRPLGPPHQRFPDMHPEPGGHGHNPVFKDIERARSGVSFAIIAGIFFYTMFGLLLMALHSRLTMGTWNLTGIYVIFAFCGGGGLFFTLLAFLPRPPVPSRLNRVTQELILCESDSYKRVPWASVPARILKEPNYRGATFDYILQLGIGPNMPDEPLGWLTIGGGSTEEAALRDWEFYCRYMESPDGYVAFHETPEREKSALRQVKEEEAEGLLSKAICIFFHPVVWFSRPIYCLVERFRKPLPLPQEVIDLCEGNPLYQQWLKNEKSKGRWAQT